MTVATIEDRSGAAESNLRACVRGLHEFLSFRYVAVRRCNATTDCGPEPGRERQFGPNRSSLGEERRRRPARGGSAGRPSCQEPEESSGFGALASSVPHVLTPTSLDSIETLVTLPWVGSAWNVSDWPWGIVVETEWLGP